MGVVNESGQAAKAASAGQQIKLSQNKWLVELEEGARSGCRTFGAWLSLRSSLKTLRRGKSGHRRAGCRARGFGLKHGRRASRCVYGQCHRKQTACVAWFLGVARHG